MKDKSKILAQVPPSAYPKEAALALAELLLEVLIDIRDVLQEILQKVPR